MNDSPNNQNQMKVSKDQQDEYLSHLKMEIAASSFEFWLTVLSVWVQGAIQSVWYPKLRHSNVSSTLKLQDPQSEMIIVVYFMVVKPLVQKIHRQKI